MTIDRNIDLAADFVRNSLSLNAPVTLDELRKAIRERLNGRCNPRNNDELGVDAEIITSCESEYNFEINYLSERPTTRILFSISHELGHLFLHLLEEDGNLRKDVTYQRDMTGTRQEYEANEFAAAFLMPEDIFISKCREYMEENRVNITKVADYFRVSVQAATVRGNVLDLW